MSAKTYVVIFYFGNGIPEMALGFESFAEAKDYILMKDNFTGTALKHSIDSGSILISWPEENRCVFSVKGGYTRPIEAVIKEYPSSAVKFDLTYYENGEPVKTRRFNKRQLAVDYAHKFLDGLEYEAEYSEDAWGTWKISNTIILPEITIGLRLIILDPLSKEDRHRSDCKLLGVRTNASSNKIEQAYQEIKNEYYSEQAYQEMMGSCQGIDSARIQEVEAAYERLVGETPKSKQRATLGEYACVNVMDNFYFFNVIHSRESTAVHFRALTTTPSAESKKESRKWKIQACCFIAVGILCIIGGLAILPWGILLILIGIFLISVGRDLYI